MDRFTGEPIAKLEIQARRSDRSGLSIDSAHTAADGSFTILVADPGQYQLGIGKSQEWFCTTPSIVNLTAEQSLTGITVSVSKDPMNVKVTIHITDATTGEPIDPGQVSMVSEDSHMSGRVIAGKVNLRDMHVGHYSLRVHSDTHVDQALEFDILAGQAELEHRIRMPRATSVQYLNEKTEVTPHPAGLISGDRILSWGETEIRNFSDLNRVQDELDGAKAPMRVRRGSTDITLPVGVAKLP